MKSRGHYQIGDRQPPLCEKYEIGYLESKLFDMTLLNFLMFKNPTDHKHDAEITFWYRGHSLNTELLGYQDESRFPQVNDLAVKILTEQRDALDEEVEYDRQNNVPEDHVRQKEMMKWTIEEYLGRDYRKFKIVEKHANP